MSKFRTSFLLVLTACLLVFAPMLRPPVAEAKAKPQANPVTMWTCFKAVAPSSWTGSTSYASNGTNPTLILRKANGNSQNPTKLVRLDISQDSPVAGGLIYCVVKLDVVDRYSSGGNQWLVRAKNGRVSAATQPQFTMYDGATATAESSGGSDPRTIYSGTIFQTVTGLGTGFVLDFQPDDAIYENGSVLIYLYAATTAPTFRGTLTVQE